MRVLYGICLLLFAAFIALPLPAFAQRPARLTFAEIPCDSTSCDVLVFTNAATTIERIRTLRFRDGVSFRIDSSLQRPDTIPAGGSLPLRICFTPARRGTISDSLLVVIQTSGGLDSVRVRLSGRGIGPELNVTPSVLNFPTTNPSGSATLKMRIRNDGERTFRLTASALTIPSPFRLVTPLPINILPGDSIEIDIAFEPTANGVYSAPVDLFAGCSNRIRLGLNGVTDLVGTGALLRQNKVGFNPANAEQISCAASRCADVTLSNVGNTTLTIDSLAFARGTVGYRLDGSVQLPILIAPGQQQGVRVCMESSNRGVQRDTLVIRSNTRNSISFGLIVDVSNSMALEIDCGQGEISRRIIEAVKQAKSFLQNTLLYIPTINLQDQIAISEYGDYPTNIFPRRSVTDAVRLDAIGAVDTLTATGGATFTGTTLRSMMDILEDSPLPDRVIVLLTDGVPSAEDIMANPTEALIAEANARGIRIFTIGLGLRSGVGGIEFLDSLSRQTRAASFFSDDCGSLQGAFESITDIVSRGTITREPFAIRVTAPTIVASGSMRFDSTYIHGEVCDTLTLTNVGEGDAVVDDVALADLDGGNREFTLGSGVLLPLVVPESGQIRVPVCFTPDSLRERAATIRFDYNNCGTAVEVDTLSGAGYAVANLRTDGQFARLPGQTVTIPVYGDSMLVGYGVKRITYHVRWNKTMLQLREVSAGSALPGATVAAQPTAYSGPFATAEITITGTDLASAGELARLEFDVLRGDTLASIVEIISATFQDGNPRTLLSGPAGLVAYDSTCFRDFKAVRRQASSKVSVGSVVPTPTGGTTIAMPLTATAATNVAIEIYSMDGTLAHPVEHRKLQAGASDLSLDLHGLPVGRYYALIRTADGEIHLRTIILAH